jgi:hypothetical protein
MEWPGVPRYAERNPPGDGDELAERAFDGDGRSGGGLDDGVGKGLFARANIDYDAESLGDEVDGDGSVSLGRPTLCAPSRAWIDEDHGVAGGQDLIGPGIGNGVKWELGKYGR